MFERFRDGLVYPDRVINFRKDSFLRVFSYMFLFAIIMSLGMIIFALDFDELPNSYANVFDDYLIAVDTDCATVNAELVCTNEEVLKFYDDGQVLIYVDSTSEITTDDYKMTLFNFVFHKDQLYLVTSGLNMSFGLSELPNEFQTLDFSLLKTDSLEFSEYFLQGVSDYMVSNKSIWAPIMIGVEILINVVLSFGLILLNAWIVKTRFKIVPYKEMFAMTAYSSTGILTLLAINGLIDLGMGMIFLFVILVFRQTNGLTRTIMKAIKKK